MYRKTISRRQFLALAAATTAGALLAACAPAAPQSSGSSSATSDNAAEVTVWHWDNFLTPPYEEEIKLFQAQTPNVKVKIENTPWGEYSQKMGAAIAGGTPPDISGTATIHFTNLAGKNQLVDLEPFMQKSNVDMNDMPKQALVANRWKGKQVSIPTTTDAGWIFYNVDMFKAEGLKTPTEYWKEENWTWDTYLELAEKLTKGEGADKQWGTRQLGVSNEYSFYPAVRTADGDFFDAEYKQAILDQTGARSAYDFYYALRPFAPGPEDAKTGVPESGKIGMWWEWELYYQMNLGRMPFTYSIAPIPANPRTKKYGFAGDHMGWGILAGSQNPEAAWSYLAFLMTEESLRRLFLAVAQPPPFLSLFTAEWFTSHKALPEPDLCYEITQLRLQNIYNGPKMSNWNELWTVQGEEMSLVWAEDQPLEQGINKVVERWNSLLKEADIDPETN